MESRITSNGIIRYPYLGKYKTNNKNEEFIVLFINPEKGMVVNAEPGSGVNLGEYQGCWDINKFEVFYGKIELSNL